MQNAMVSIIIPTYSRRELAIGAIESAMLQTYPNIEIIVVEDGPSSGIEYDIHKINNNKIVYYRHNKRKGLGATRNTGTRIAKGEYIAFLDDDDRWHKNKISSQIKIAKIQDKIPNMIYCGTCKINDKKVISEDIPQFKGKMIEFIFNGFCLPSSCMLMTKESIMSIGGHSEELISCIDHDIWMNMSLNGFEMDFAPEGLVYSPEHNNSKMVNQLDDRILGIEQFYVKWKKVVINKCGTEGWYFIERLYHLQTVKTIIDQETNGFIDRIQSKIYLDKIFKLQHSKVTLLDKLILDLNIPNFTPVNIRIRRMLNKVLQFFKEIKLSKEF